MRRKRRAGRPARRGPALAAAALALILVGGGLWYVARNGAGAGGVARDRHGDLVQTVPTGGVPLFAERAGADVVLIYLFAASEQGKALEWIPCYCGCGRIGHEHNRHCYLKDVGRDSTTFTSHGAG